MTLHHFKMLDEVQVATTSSMEPGAEESSSAGYHALVTSHFGFSLATEQEQDPDIKAVILS